MRRTPAIIASVFVAASVSAQPAIAAGDLSQQEPIEIRIELGKSGSEEHAFYPNEIVFETGKLYKLVIHNPSSSPHYFTSHDFTQRIYTRKVQVSEPSEAGERIAEIKGAIREVEVYPGGTSEWWFVPVATGTISDLECHVEDSNGLSHAEQGMTGTIIIR